MTSGPSCEASSPAARSARALDLALRLGLLTLLLDASMFWFERVPIAVAAVVGLLFPAALRSRLLWFSLVVLTSWPLLWNWPFSDNHSYLKAVFCLAVACAVWCPDPRAALARSARLLIGLTFLFATIWKLLLSPDFVDGSFFRITLLTDGRFENLAVLAGGMTYDDWAQNDLAIDTAISGEQAWDQVDLVEPPELVRLARAATFFTGAIEALLALAFLWPGGRGISRLRDPALLLFALVTYPVATVRGFGWLLMTMGIAQCDPARRTTRIVYVAVFCLVEIFRSVPWDDALVAAFGVG